jgi:D-lactate dehydrogenase
MPPERVRTRYIDLMSFSSDTGFYYFVPQAVVPPVSEAVEVALFASPQQRGVPLVFRTGGTILSGQAIADGLLVDLSQFWAQLTVEQGGELG